MFQERGNLVVLVFLLYDLINILVITAEYLNNNLTLKMC